MYVLKKFLLVLMVFSFLTTGFSCSNTNGNDDGGDNPQTATIQKVNASMLDGKVANLMGAEGFAILDKTEKPSTASASPFSASFYDAGTKNSQKKTEFVKTVENGVSDVHFHEVGGGIKKSYKHLNKKYATHHHKTIECGVVDCDEISDEITQEEQSGNVESVLSLGARVNKLYTVGNYTFVSISSAIEGEIRVLSVYEGFANNNFFTPEGGFPTYVNINDNLVTDKGFGFSWISFNDNGKSGMIPIKVFESEENYHKINYWSDDYNQSFIIDNTTGLTVSLSQFSYIYSVDGGIIKIYNKSATGGFDYYRPTTSESGIIFNKVELPNDQEFINAVGGSQVYTDVYGNLVFSSKTQVLSQEVNVNGERKVDSNIIFAQKNLQIINSLANNNLFKNNYSKANCYHNGSDGRLYRVNFFGDINNLSVSVLDENCDWKAVEKNVSVEFRNAYVVWRIGQKATEWDSLKLTCIIDGQAYFSTAANTDGGKLWPKASFYTHEQFVGVIKVPTDGVIDGQNTAIELIEEFKQNGVLSNKNIYSVVLVGQTQMLYFGNNKIFLRDVETEQEVYFAFTVSAYGPHPSANLFVQGLGYLNLDENLDLSTFGSTSFSSQPVDKNSEFEEYYKLLKNIK